MIRQGWCGLVRAAALVMLAGGAASAEGPRRCPASPPPIRDLLTTGYYEDGSGGAVANAERKAAEIRASAMPVALAEQVEAAALPDADLARSVCAARALRDWAAEGGLTGRMSRQGFYKRAWLTTGIAAAYRPLRARLQLAGARGMAPADRAAIDAWLIRIAEDTIRRYAGPASRWNGPDSVADFTGPSRLQRTSNLTAWAGASVAAIGAATDRPALLGWARDRAGEVLETVTPEGMMPSEVQRRQMALHYHLYAQAPLALIDRLLADAGQPLGGRAQAALARLTAFCVAALADPAAIARAAGALQALPPARSRARGTALAGLELYAASHPSPAIERLVAPLRPLHAPYLGGDVTWLWGRGRTQRP